MHKFLRAVGFSRYQKKKDIEELLDLLEKQSSGVRCFQMEESANICEIRAEAAPGIGISIVGELNKNGCFEREFYLPYLDSQIETTNAECSIQRHAARETYAGMADEMRIGTSLIFYVQNFLEYREKNEKKHVFHVSSINLAGLSVGGKILFPVQKSQQQIEKAKAALKNRNNLIEAARNGDETAMETLTIEDIDLYSQISRRAMKEDLYSIIDSCFMPCGVECDQYSVIGEILEIQKFRNIYTKEELYYLLLECCDMVFPVCINSQDLLGEPMVGRRFKGQIWMQGILNLEEIPKSAIL